MEYLRHSIQPAPENSGEDWDIAVVSLKTSGLLWWRKTEEHVVIYRGSDTVWHELSTGERPGTHMEAWLSSQAWLREQRDSADESE